MIAVPHDSADARRRSLAPIPADRERRLGPPGRSRGAPAPRRRPRRARAAPPKSRQGRRVRAARPVGGRVRLRAAPRLGRGRSPRPGPRQRQHRDRGVDGRAPLRRVALAALGEPPPLDDRGDRNEPRPRGRRARRVRRGVPRGRLRGRARRLRLRLFDARAAPALPRRRRQDRPPLRRSARGRRLDALDRAAHDRSRSRPRDARHRRRRRDAGAGRMARPARRRRAAGLRDRAPDARRRPRRLGRRTRAPGNAPPRGVRLVRSHAMPRKDRVPRTAARAARARERAGRRRSARP